MNRFACVFTACLPILVWPAYAWSKGETVRITIDGDGLAAPIDITDPDIVGQFTVWEGPGTRVCGPNRSGCTEYDDVTGRFVDWPKGIVTSRPEGLQRVEVTLYVDVPDEPPDSARYVFAYEIDPGRHEGYIFLPMWKNDLISHGVELNWLHAHPHWDTVIMPIVAERSDPMLEPSGDPLPCTAGRGFVHPDGTIEFGLVDESGVRSSHWRYDPATPRYRDVRALLGDVPTGEEIDIPCWPARDPR